MDLKEDIIDLSALDSRAGAEQGFDVELLHPRSGEKLGATIRVLGFESEAYQGKMAEIRRRSLEQLRKSKQRIATPEEIERETVDTLVEVTIGWNLGPLKWNGQAIEFSKDNARKLYRQFLWIREQIDQAIHDRANFFPASAKS